MTDRHGYLWLWLPEPLLRAMAKHDAVYFSNILSNDEITVPDLLWDNSTRAFLLRALGQRINQLWAALRSDALAILKPLGTTSVSEGPRNLILSADAFAHATFVRASKDPALLAAAPDLKRRIVEFVSKSPILCRPLEYPSLVEVLSLIHI